jgi:hypothetical protein
MAEKGGFEPPVGSHLRLISSQVHSTALPPLHKLACCRLKQQGRELYAALLGLG